MHHLPPHEQSEQQRCPLPVLHHAWVLPRQCDWQWQSSAACAGLAWAPLHQVLLACFRSPLPCMAVTACWTAATADGTDKPAQPSTRAARATADLHLTRTAATACEHIRPAQAFPCAGKRLAEAQLTCGALAFLLHLECLQPCPPGSLFACQPEQKPSCSS